MTRFSQCSSSKNLDNQPPVDFGEVYTQSWTAGVKGGGSGTNLFIPVKDHSVELDSVYYKGNSAKLENKPDSPDLYIGRFERNSNQPQDMIISSDPREEAKNTLPQVPEKIPFELKDDECVVFYQKEGKTHYYKISGITTKLSKNYPSAPPNRQ